VKTSPEHSIADRRRLLRPIAAAVALLACGRGALAAEPETSPFPTQKRWFEAAAAMKRLAESWGDQPYGAVLVAGDTLIGEGPSRVIKLGDASAHAEREAIRDAQRRLGRKNLAGSVLYSTSRPCRQCELAAAQAQVSRMIHGEALIDAGPPRP
jgi:tRNA(Arg) A34 adenosine deaminase TadA